MYFPEILWIEAPHTQLPWRAYLDPGLRSWKSGQGSRATPSAIVEVLGRMPRPESREERLEAYALTLAPLVRRAFDVGRSTTIGRQFAADIMSQFMSDPTRMNPPAVPDVFYNSYRPLLTDLEQRRRLLDPDARSRAGSD